MCVCSLKPCAAEMQSRLQNEWLIIAAGAKEKLSLRVHGLIVGSPEKKRADPAVLRSLCSQVLPNGKMEVLSSVACISAAAVLQCMLHVQTTADALILCRGLGSRSHLLHAAEMWYGSSWPMSTSVFPCRPW